MDIGVKFEVMVSDNLKLPCNISSIENILLNIYVYI